MSKRLVRVYRRVYHRSTAFALERPNMATAFVILFGVFVCVALWAIIVPIFAPLAIAHYLPASAAAAL